GLSNSTSTASPIALNSRPPHLAISSSIERRQAARRRAVPSSSASIRLEKPTMSPTKIAANRRFIGRASGRQRLSLTYIGRSRATALISAHRLRLPESSRVRFPRSPNLLGSVRPREGGKASSRIIDSLVRTAGVEPAQAFRPYGFSYQLRLSPPRPTRNAETSSWSGLSLRRCVAESERGRRRPS